MEEGKLNAKQEAFVYEYMKDFNGKQAAIRAGYSHRSAESTSSTLLSYPKVKAAVAKFSEAVAEKSKVSVQTIIDGLAEIAFPQAPAVVFPRDRLKAMELLGKHLGMFVERREHSGPGGKAIEVSAKTWLEVMDLETESNEIA